MDDLIIDDVDEETMKCLRAQARKNRRSLEAEVLAILEEAVGFRRPAVPARRRAPR
jgi:plasmid stability protein